jgi:hypothetical protein
MSFTGRVFVAIALAVILGACSSGSHGPTASQAANSAHPYVPPSTTTISPSQQTDVFALARSIGCANPKPNTSPSVDIGPKALASIDCTLPDGSTARIQTYTPGGVKQVKALVPTVGCSFAKSFGITDLYAAYGKDFTASINSENGADTRPQSEALAKALGVPLTTIHCP